VAWLHRAIPGRVPALHPDQHAHGRGRVPGRARRYFYSSSACAYNTLLQQDPQVRALKESDAYRRCPSALRLGKLISEMFCQEYWAERGMKTAIARFHNVYGRMARGTADARRPRGYLPQDDRGDRQKRSPHRIWATARHPQLHVHRRLREGHRPDHAQRCAHRHADQPGSSELIAINDLVSKVEQIAGVKLKRSTT